MTYRSSEPTEVELRERRTSIRRDQDELQGRADRLAREIAEASRGGILGAIGNLIGGMTEDELARARVDHAALEAALAALVQRERDVDSQLAFIDATRADLAAQAATRIEAARASAGPLGDQLRAIASVPSTSATGWATTTPATPGVSKTTTMASYCCSCSRR